MASVVGKVERKITYRYVLNSPYTLQWDQADPSSADELHALVVEFLSATKLTGLKFTEETHGKFLACGINSVGASAEAGDLACMLACIPNFQSRGMFEHLPTLCKVKGVKLLTSSMTPTKLGKLFQCRTVLVLGFKKSCLEDPALGLILSKLMDPAKPYCFVTAPWFANNAILPVSTVTPLQAVAYRPTVPNNSRITADKHGPVADKQRKRADPSTFIPKKKQKKTAKTDVNK